MIMPGDYIEEKNLLVISRMLWVDIKKKLDDQGFAESYKYVYDEEKERFEHRSRTHKLWQVMNSDGKLGTYWEKRRVENIK